MLHKISNILGFKRPMLIQTKLPLFKTTLTSLEKHYATEATVEFEPFKFYKLPDAKTPTEARVTKEEAFALLEEMTYVRKMETAASQMYLSKTIRGFCHLCSGQEAISSGMKAAMSPGDQVITAYRCHGWAYVMGVSLEEILCELTGVRSWCARGKGGSMHMYCKDFYGGNGIVGAQVPLGIGVAFSNKYDANNHICITLYGDGAANQGQVFEAFNMAKLWNLPVIFVCENNLYGMGTSTERSSANADYYTRGQYIPGVCVDGMDVIAVRECTKFCYNHIKSGKGPIIVEAILYRYYGHSMSDPGTSYRTREEVQSVRESRDPITLLKDKIIDLQLGTKEELKKIDAKTKAKVDAAVTKSKTDKEIDMSELTADIYSEWDAKTLLRNVLPYKPLKHVFIKAG